MQVPDMLREQDFYAVQHLVTAVSSFRRWIVRHQQSRAMMSHLNAFLLKRNHLALQDLQSIFSLS